MHIIYAAPDTANLGTKILDFGGSDQQITNMSLSSHFPVTQKFCFPGSPFSDPALGGR